MLGWSALSSLVLEVSAQSDDMVEALSFTNMAIAVCAVVAALIVFTRPELRDGHRNAAHKRCRNDDETESLRALAAQVRCAENRARLLSLANQRL